MTEIGFKTFMSSRKASFVIIRYGPYKAFGTIDHRTQKLNGLCSALSDLGYEIVLVPVNEYNRMCIEMYDREIFRCDIRNLLFNMPIEEDPVCQRALAAIEEAQYRMGAVQGEDNQVTKKHISASSLDQTTAFLNEYSEQLLYKAEENIVPKSTSRLGAHEEGEEKIGKVKIIDEKDAINDTQHNQLQELFDDVVHQNKPGGNLSNKESEVVCSERNGSCISGSNLDSIH